MPIEDLHHADYKENENSICNIIMYEGGICTFWPQFEFLKAANLHISSDYLIQWPQQNSEM